MNKEPNTITEKQHNFIVKLVSQKDLVGVPERCKLTQEQLTWLGTHGDGESGELDRLSMESASFVIGELLALNDKPVQTKLQVEEPVPDAGYYFINDPTRKDEEDNPIPSFFKVQKGKEGTRWEGYTFLEIQASDYFYPIKDIERRSLIFAEILKDPVNAMNEYGLRLGRCGVCNRTLTDRHSILRGIGPICAARLESQPTEEDLDMLRQLGFNAG